MIIELVSSLCRFKICLRKNEQRNSECRVEMRDYLGCRMNTNLMAKEEWSHLGLRDLAPQDTPKDIPRNMVSKDNLRTQPNQSSSGAGSGTTGAGFSQDRNKSAGNSGVS